MDALVVDLTYGAALFEAARDLGKIDIICEELDAIEAVFQQEPMFFSLINSPSVTAEARKASLTAVFGDHVAEEVLNFLYVLIDKRRIGQFGGIVRRYRKLVNDNLGITKGVIYSAEPLQPEKLQRFETEASKLFQKTVELTNETDQEMIGGVKILVEGKLIDASIRKRLDDLRDSLM